MILRRLFLPLCLILLAPTLRAQTEFDLVMPNSRAAALGGYHTALADDFQTLFANPAGLLDVEPRFSYSELTIGASGPVFSLASIVMQSLGGSDFATLLASPSVQDLLRSIYARFSLAGPISFGYAGAGMGFGVFNDSQMIVQSTGSSALEIRVGERFLLRGGYGLGIPLPESWNSRLAVGLGLKGFVRGDAVIATSLLTLPTLVESIGPELLTESPFELVSGIGVDAGLRWVWSETLAAAVTVDSLYSPNGVVRYPTLSGFLDSSGTPSEPVYDTYPQEVNLGLAYTPSLGGVGRYVQDFTLLYDYSDVFDFWIDRDNAENLALKMSLGVEATFLEVLSVRGGFAQGLFAAGLGIDLTYLELNAAMFGTELSSEPGLRPVYNLIVGLEFRG
ncbi:MAG: hypothetical protein ACOC2N_01755 [Spirochaetota bacterium]